MAIKIKELPEEERPYEKLELYGEKSLSNAELLAIIIKTGTKNQTSVEIATQILNLNNNQDKNNLNFIKELSIQELMCLKGIGRVKAIQIKAVCELAKRMNTPSNYKKVQINRPVDIAKLLMSELKNQKNEIVKIIILNNKNIIIKILDVAIGSGNFATFNIRGILSEVLKANEPKMILVHNHPSGDPTPSKQDFETTEKLQKAAKMLNIELLDHIVIGDMQYESIMQCKEWKIRQEGKEWF